MSKLYTVTMTREEIICRYDVATGNRLSEERRDIPQVYGDMPWSTALGYQTNFPNNNVVITEQASDYTPPARVYVHEAPAYRPRPATVGAARPSAAATGDLAAALS